MRYTKAEIEAMPTLFNSFLDELKAQAPNSETWYRPSTARVTVQIRQAAGSWVVTDQYIAE